MTAVIKCLGLAGVQFVGSDVPVGLYLKSYDPEANDGWSASDWTKNVNEARKFEDGVKAWETWTAVPKNRPLRPDGKPNRPLTAYSVEIETIPD